MVHRMGRGEGAGRTPQAATQPVVRIQPGRLRVHQPVILPGVVLDELAEPLGDEAGTELQQHLGPGQLGHEAAVLQGEIHVDEVAAVEAIWLCKSASSGQPRRSASWATLCASAGS